MASPKKIRAETVGSKASDDNKIVRAIAAAQGLKPHDVASMCTRLGQTPRRILERLLEPDVAGAEPGAIRRRRVRDAAPRLPRGVASIDSDGWLSVPLEMNVETMVKLSPLDRWVAAELRGLIGDIVDPVVGVDPRLAPRPTIIAGQGYQFTPEGIVPLLSPTTSTAEKLHASATDIERLHRAYEVWTGWPARAEWQRKIRGLVWWALMFLQSPGREKRRAASDALTGATILAKLQETAPPGTLPTKLIKAAIDKVLSSATISERGGGTGRRKQSYQKAIDALIRSVGDVPHSPNK